MFSVNQPWDPLQVCAVGSTYPPEYYSWIKVPHVRELFEKIAQETEEDFQKLIAVLKKFNVEIVRPEIQYDIESVYKEPPPMCPRDHMIMINDCLYYKSPVTWNSFYNAIKDNSWPLVDSIDLLSPEQQLECLAHGWNDPLTVGHPGFRSIFQHCKNHSVKMLPSPFDRVNGAETTRIGKDLYFGTHYPNEDSQKLHALAKRSFPDYRTYILDTQGHNDGTFCPVVPGLIISLYDLQNYQETFPDWEVVYLPNQSWNKISAFLKLKEKNKGRWWIPGFEFDQSVVDVVENWLTHWTGYVEETVFDVNMLVIDPKNVIVFGHNDIVFNALSKYNITAHIVPLRHRYFWDGGIHCVTADLSRNGPIQDFFPNRNQ
jgi:hypothetical protein